MTLPVINSVLLTLITVGIGVVASQLRAIREQVTKTNGRVTALETWKDEHKAWVMQRHNENVTEHGELREDNRLTRKSVHDLRNEAFKVQLRHEVSRRSHEEEDR